MIIYPKKYSGNGKYHRLCHSHRLGVSLKKSELRYLATMRTYRLGGKIVDMIW